MSKVSVVIPIYNPGRKLHKCIRSIINQSYENIEIILVNDGSTDNSLNICKKYERRDRRIVVIDKENEGSIKTRRRGGEAASSEFIMFVDADDWVHTNIIEILYKHAVKDNIDITVCNTNRVINRFIQKKNRSAYFNQDKIFQDDEIKEHLVTAYFHGHPFPSSLCAKLYKKEYFINSGKYLDDIHFLGDDLYLNLEILLMVKKVKIINQSLYYYKIGGFTSRYMPFMFNDMVTGYEIQKEVIESYYHDNRMKHYRGVSIMLLNTFKTCLQNLFSSNLSEMDIKKIIYEYSSNTNVIECLKNEGSTKYFLSEYLNAIQQKNVDYLYKLGRTLHKKSLVKKNVMRLVSAIT